MIHDIGRVNVSHHDGNGTWLITLEGEHDLATMPGLEQQTIAVWPQCSYAIVDLSRASFIDSTTVHWLLRARHTVEVDHKAQLVIADGAPDSFAARVLGVLGLRDVLGCYPTAGEALRHAAESADTSH